MGFKLTEADEQKLEGVHPDLVKVIRKAAEITSVPFKVTEGRRSMARQKVLKAQGFSSTLRSRHLTGHAVDIVPLVDVNGNGRIEHEEMYSWPLYYKLAPVVKQAAKLVGVPVEWGGDWKSFKDGPHWQLPWSKYALTQSQDLMLAQDAAQSGVGGDYLSDPEYEHPTEGRSLGNALAIASTGVGTGASVGYEPLVQASVTALGGQQSELTSGDIARILIALVVVLGSVWLAWRAAK